MARLSKPKNRRAEALNLMMKKSWFNYYDMAKELNNLNVHRIREYLQTEHGVVFAKRNKKFVNRFGRPSRFNEFKISTPKSKLVEIYNTINNK